MSQEPHTRSIKTDTPLSSSRMLLAVEPLRLNNPRLGFVHCRPSSDTARQILRRESEGKGQDGSSTTRSSTTRNNTTSSMRSSSTRNSTKSTSTAKQIKTSWEQMSMWWPACDRVPSSGMTCGERCHLSLEASRFLRCNRSTFDTDAHSSLQAPVHTHPSDCQHCDRDYGRKTEYTSIT